VYRVLVAARGSNLLADPGVRRIVLEYLPISDLEHLAHLAGVTPQRTPFDTAAILAAKAFSIRSEWVQRLSALLELSPGIGPAESHLSGIEDVEPYSAPPALLDYQIEAVREIVAILRARSPRKILLQLPTGAGKTRIAMESVTEFLGTSSAAGFGRAR
jgi:hypothetical protein